MYYSGICLLAVLILIISNHDVLFKNREKIEVPAHSIYRLFLYCVLVFFVIDFSWGIFDYFHLIPILYSITFVFFLIMSVTILCWTKYVLAYLEQKSLIGKILLIGGFVFVGFSLISLIVNAFSPFLFKFDGNTYVALPARYTLLGLQVILFLLVALFTFIMGFSIRRKRQSRYITIGLFGLAMSIMVSIQMFYPLLPIYTAGLLLGTTILHSFVIEDEKEEYREKLEQSLTRELRQRSELGTAKKLAYTDPLTGVKNKLAYVEDEAQMEEKVATNVVGDFAVVVFDLNGLKTINDTKGHEKGDEYIVSSCQIITKYFKTDRVYRIGGDEFAAILQGEDYLNRYKNFDDFNALMIQNAKSGDTVIASGISEFIRGEDENYQNVFKRADRAMYRRKEELKKLKIEE